MNPYQDAMLMRLLRWDGEHDHARLLVAADWCEEQGRDRLALGLRLVAALPAKVLRIGPNYFWSLTQLASIGINTSRLKGGLWRPASGCYATYAGAIVNMANLLYDENLKKGWLHHGTENQSTGK